MNDATATFDMKLEVVVIPVSETRGRNLGNLGTETWGKPGDRRKGNLGTDGTFP